MINRDNYDDVINGVTVSHILKYPYSGVRFKGVNNIVLSLRELCIVMASNSPVWKSHLAAMPGIYLITDRKTGKWYVGSAYGEENIWHRWNEYANTLTGGHKNESDGNKDFRDLVAKYGPEYIKDNFQYSVLELLPAGTKKDPVLARDHFWMRALDTHRHGYNNN